MAKTMNTTGPPAGGVLYVKAGGSTLGAADREKLVREGRGGKWPARLTVDAVVFRDTTAPNRNHLRFKKAILPRLAESFVGMPFLRDHEQRDLAARGGTVVASRFDGGDMHQTIELAKPWAIEGALDGTISTFSIGWHNTGDVVCSACDAPFTNGCFGMFPSCDHMVGDHLRNAKGEVVGVVEMVVTGAEGVETSAVSVPAVAGTRIAEIRAELSLARTLSLSRPVEAGSLNEHELKVCRQLGLTAEQYLRHNPPESRRQRRAARRQG